MRVVDSSQQIGERLALDIRLELAPLYVNADGTLGRGSRSYLAFFAESRVSRDSPDTPFTVLSLPGEDMRGASVPVKFVNLLDLPNQEILGWELLSPDGLAMVHTPQQTLFFQGGSNEPPGPYPFPIYLRPTGSAAVSATSGRFAAVARYGEQATPAVDSARQVLVAFNPEGEAIMESSPTRSSYGQLYLTPSGETLIFRRTCRQEAAETVALDIGTSQSSSVDVEDGIRYYSEDGTRMVVIQMGLGAATYYDVSDPFNPIRLGDYQADDFIVTAAVCDDGSLLALQILNAEGNPSRVTKRVVVLDDSMLEVDEPIATADQVNMGGLQWEGTYLFVGIQRHPLPVPVNYRTTERIRVYDYSE